MIFASRGTGTARVANLYCIGKAVWTGIWHGRTPSFIKRICMLAGGSARATNDITRRDMVEQHRRCWRCRARRAADALARRRAFAHITWRYTFAFKNHGALPLFVSPLRCAGLAPPVARTHMPWRRPLGGIAFSSFCGRGFKPFRSLARILIPAHYLSASS